MSRFVWAWFRFYGKGVSNNCKECPAIPGDRRNGNHGAVRIGKWIGFRDYEAGIRGRRDAGSSFLCRVFRGWLMQHIADADGIRIIVGLGADACGGKIEEVDAQPAEIPQVVVMGAVYFIEKLFFCSCRRRFVVFVPIPVAGYGYRFTEPDVVALHVGAHNTAGIAMVLVAELQ